ncbi:MAG: hypothetical protein QGG40_19085, partial [Myxococcota bacterium]|nr:hypothetical protein [Myxococcota bacterium]
MPRSLMIHYHKSGCSLSQQIVRSFLTELNGNLQMLMNPLPRKKYGGVGRNIVVAGGKFMFPVLNFETDFGEMRVGDQEAEHVIYNQGNPNFFYPFEEVIPGRKVIHFVREPYAMALSNYLYHTQVPTPEPWFLTLHTDVEEWLDPRVTRVMNFMAGDLGLDVRDIESLVEQVKGVWRCPPGSSYYDHLRSIPMHHGLLVETVRFMVRMQDFLRMAMIRRRASKNFIQFFMADFDGEDKSRASLERINDFLFPGEAVDMDKVAGAFRHNRQRIGRTRHVTRHLVSRDRRAELINGLKQNRELANIFGTVDGILRGEGDFLAV